MARPDRRVKLHLVRLEDRNAASDTLHYLLGTLGIASIFDTSSFDTATTPPTSLSAVDPSYLTASPNRDANDNVALNPPDEPVISDSPAVSAGDNGANV